MNLSFRTEEYRDFEELGYRTVLECRDDEERAMQICGHRLYAYECSQHAKIGRSHSEIEQCKNECASLHEHLYDRAEPVNDAQMLTHRKHIRISLALAILAAIACLAGNSTTFVLYGYGLLLTMLFAAGATVLPLVVGHYGYEWIAKHNMIQMGIITLCVALCFAGLYKLAAARSIMLDRTFATAPATSSYVDGAEPAANAVDQEIHTNDGAENQVKKTFGDGMLLIMFAADIMLGFLVGRLSKLHTDRDYAAWREVQTKTESITGMEETIASLHSSVEIAKRNCAAGMLRAHAALKKRKTPYHRPLLSVILLALFGAAAAHAQNIERYEGILIDTSGSISRNGTTSELFREYLLSTKKLLATEAPNTRVLVSGIAVDSFGGDGTILKGWTPESHGIFTDDLNRARRQLVSSFEQKSSKLTPVAAGTDIFGALWRFNALFGSTGKSANTQTKTIWIFSDMINETPNFQMPSLLPTGPEQMLERAKANGLIVPLNGYKIYIYGATPNGLSPQAWLAIKSFWTLYFQAAGAELARYSAECDAAR